MRSNGRTGTSMGGALVHTRGPKAHQKRQVQMRAARIEAERLGRLPDFDYGTTDEQRRLVAVFGPKPKSIEWQHYRTQARTRPFTLDRTRAHRDGTPQVIVDPRRPIYHPRELRSLSRLADKVADGSIDRDQYLAILAALKYGMTPDESKVTR